MARKVIIYKASIRRDLQFADKEGVDCLPNSTIFKQLASMGYEKEDWERFSWRITPLFPTIVVQSQLGEDLAMPTDSYHTPTNLQPSTSQPQKTHKPRKRKRKVTQVPQLSGPTKSVADEAVYMELDDSLTKTTQALEITSLKSRVKKLEKKQRSRTYKLKRLYKGRKINDIDVDEDITLVNDQDDAQMFDVNIYMVKSAVSEVNAASIATTVSAAGTFTTEEITLAQALVKIKTSKPKAKRIVLQELSESTTTTTTIITLKKSQDKGKAIMIEEPVKAKKKVQIMIDKETAKSLQDKFDEEEIIEREKAEKELEANIALIEEWDDIQA
uniref:Uncharacterized protein n=1 Tax=Tanacetum cinerariifolium TaxID=118510 RepID=A0A699JMK6_TANCI|nr:hypothetical protein [Tanacetum cinerariifolium]